ncbi:MAG TPA: hypothetical protein VKA70_10940 [Blastocatellia bacterium]|nr:hypothetical protein [Blastocatellia bacterium]
MLFRSIRPVTFSLLIILLAVISLNFSNGDNRHKADRLARIKESAKKFDRETKRFDEPAEAEEFFRFKRSPDQQSALGADRYLKAIDHAEMMPGYSIAADSRLPSKAETGLSTVELAALDGWTQLGPANVGGRTRVLLIDPTNAAVMYAAGVAGGVWKTINAGASWQAVGDLLPSLAVCSMAFEPGNSNVIYAGTGEGFFNGDMVRGAGIFKTTDAGGSWTFLEATNGADFFYVNDIVVSPNDPRRVYAGTRSGLWRSLDAGATWARVLLPLSASGGIVQGGCLDLAIRTDLATDYLFASCGSFTQATVYLNASAGDPVSGSGAWTPVLREAGIGRTALAIAPSNQNVVYALASSVEQGLYDRGLHAVFRSTASGVEGSWTARVRNNSATKLNTALLSNTVFALMSECEAGSSNLFFNQGWYDNTIAVDPVDPERVWVGGVDLFRSDDGGANWGIASYWWGESDEPQYVHADQHTIVFHPQYDGVTNKTMFVGNDGGVYRTADARARTARGRAAACEVDNGGVLWTALNNNYGVTQFYHGLPFPNGNSYIGGTQDNGTLRGSDSAGAGGWVQAFGGDGGYVAIDPTATDTVYVENTRLSIRKTVDGGRTYTTVITGISEPTSNFLFINPFIMDPSNPQRLWTGGSVLWRTDNGGVSWTQASAATAGGAVSALAVSGNNPDRVIAGTSIGFIHRNDRGAKSRSTSNWPSALPRNGFVSWVAFDPNNASVVYATYSTFGGSHVWRSTDGGASFSPSDGSGETRIPDIPVHSIIVDPTNSSRLFVGTDIGVFVSLDGGGSWARENNGFANVVTESLALATSEGSTYLFAFTHGRSVWRVPIGPAVFRITQPVARGKHLHVFGQGFKDGAALLVNGVEQANTNNDVANPTTVIITKKGVKKLPKGQSVTLQVRNPDGALTPGFAFTRP